MNRTVRVRTEIEEYVHVVEYFTPSEGGEGERELGGREEERERGRERRRGEGERECGKEG